MITLSYHTYDTHTVFLVLTPETGATWEILLIVLSIPKVFIPGFQSYS